MGLNCPSGDCTKISKYLVNKADPADLENPQVADDKPLIGLVSAFHSASDTALQAEVGKFVDWDNLLGVYATELVAGDMDGLLGAGTNLHLQDPSSGLLHVVRGGADAAFATAIDPSKPSNQAVSQCSARVDAAYARIWAHPALRKALLAKVRALLCGAFAKDAIADYFAKYRSAMEAESAGDPKLAAGLTGAAATFTQITEFVYARHTALAPLLESCQ